MTGGLEEDDKEKCEGEMPQTFRQGKSGLKRRQREPFGQKRRTVV